MSGIERRLAAAARDMIAAAAAGRSAAAVLRQSCPHIYRQLRQLPACPALRPLWGRSRNVDEHAGEVIVDPAILRALGRLSGIPVRGRVVHAGLQHTYGYLFSLIETPFGYKRERWTRPVIEAGFGIDRPALRAEPAEGTLLTNLTWFAGEIAFRGRPRMLGRLHRLAEFVSPALRGYDYENLEIDKVSDKVVRRSAGGEERLVTLQTDLVRFPHPPEEAGADSHLLIYSAIEGEAGPARLITAFPVRRATAEELTARRRPHRVRLDGLPYNAHVAGLGERPFVARRRVVRAGAS